MENKHSTYVMLTEESCKRTNSPAHREYMLKYLRKGTNVYNLLAYLWGKYTALVFTCAGVYMCVQRKRIRASKTCPSFSSMKAMNPLESQQVVPDQEYILDSLVLSHCNCPVS